MGFRSGVAVSAIVTKGADEYALAVVTEPWKFTCRSRITIMCDQEDFIKKLAEMTRDARPQETLDCSPGYRDRG